MSTSKYKNEKFKIECKHNKCSSTRHGKLVMIFAKLNRRTHYKSSLRMRLYRDFFLVSLAGLRSGCVISNLQSYLCCLRIKHQSNLKLQNVYTMLCVLENPLFRETAVREQKFVRKIFMIISVVWLALSWFLCGHLKVLCRF